MTEALGSEMLLKLYIGAELIGVAGLLVNSLVIDTDPIDITNKSTMSWRTLLEGGVQKVDIDAEMIVLDDAVQELLAYAASNGSTVQCAIDDVFGDGFNGYFLVGGYESTGVYDGAQTASVSLHSFGLITPGIVPPTPVVEDDGDVYFISEYYSTGTSIVIAPVFSLKTYTLAF